MTTSVNRPWLRKWVDPGTRDCEYVNIFAMHPRIKVYVFSPSIVLYSLFHTTSVSLTLTLPSHAQLTVTDRGREKRAWERGWRDRCGRDRRDLHHAYIKLIVADVIHPTPLEKILSESSRLGQYARQENWYAFLFKYFRTQLCLPFLKSLPFYVIVFVISSSLQSRSKELHTRPCTYRRTLNLSKIWNCENVSEKPSRCREHDLLWIN